MENQLTTMKNELEQELHQNILNYWIKNTVDVKNGGFIGHINHYNVPNPTAPKGSVLNARILWTFSSAYRIFKNPEYFEMANRAYHYILQHFIDKKYGGVYWELDYLGNPLNPRKQIYALSFVIYGMVEYYRACGEQKALQTAIELYELIEKHSFDTKRNGYIEALSENWEKLADLRLSEKDANESKTMNTHLHILEAYTNLYRVYKDANLQKALENLIHLFLDKFIRTDTYHLNLFFDDDWNLKGDIISYGHDIESSWLLLEAAEVLGNSALIEKVKPVSVNMAKAVFPAIDSDGGMFAEKEPSHNKLDTDKHWWPQAEAVVGFYNAYQLTGELEFAQKSVNSWEFIKKHIIDYKNGEWIWRVNQQGITNDQDEKAGFWKCPYHNGRVCMEIFERIK
ncbi:MAG: AGE family epimerase/isomerase [Salinivirgaceae bacterium]